jgi:DNA-binding HxlR family transcriptional regulator
VSGSVKRSSVGHFNCSIARTLEIVGEWWTLLIIRDAFFGVRRFDDFQRDLAISRNILSDRLGTLVEHGILDRRRYQDHPERHEYVLTDKGRDLYPVIVTLMRWGDRWESPEGAPLRLVHEPCGHDSEATVVCAHCGELLDPRHVRPRKGPGWSGVGATDVT